MCSLLCEASLGSWPPAGEYKHLGGGTSAEESSWAGAEWGQGAPGAPRLSHFVPRVPVFPDWPRNFRSPAPLTS